MSDEKKTKARVLVDCALGKCNTVVKVSAEELKAHVNLLDTEEAAVAAAEGEADESEAAAPKGKKK